MQRLNTANFTNEQKYMVMSYVTHVSDEGVFISKESKSLAAILTTLTPENATSLWQNVCEYLNDKNNQSRHLYLIFIKAISQVQELDVEQGELSVGKLTEEQLQSLSDDTKKNIINTLKVGYEFRLRRNGRPKYANYIYHSFPSYQLYRTLQNDVTVLSDKWSSVINYLKACDGKVHRHFYKHTHKIIRNIDLHKEAQKLKKLAEAEGDKKKKVKINLDAEYLYLVTLPQVTKNHKGIKCRDEYEIEQYDFEGLADVTCAVGTKADAIKYYSIASNNFANQLNDLPINEVKSQKATLLLDGIARLRHKRKEISKEIIKDITQGLNNEKCTINSFNIIYNNLKGYLEDQTWESGCKDACFYSLLADIAFEIQNYADAYKFYNTASGLVQRDFLAANQKNAAINMLNEKRIMALTQHYKCNGKAQEIVDLNCYGSGGHKAIIFFDLFRAYAAAGFSLGVSRNDEISTEQAIKGFFDIGMYSCLLGFPVMIGASIVIGVTASMAGCIHGLFRACTRNPIDMANCQVVHKIHNISTEYNDASKDELIKKIVDRYKAESSGCSSASSQRLVQQLNNANLICKEKWRLIDNYMLLKKGSHFHNNGKKLFSIIAEEVNHSNSKLMGDQISQRCSI